MKFAKMLIVSILGLIVVAEFAMAEKFTCKAKNILSGEVYTQTDSDELEARKAAMEECTDENEFGCVPFGRCLSNMPSSGSEQQGWVCYANDYKTNRQWSAQDKDYQTAYDSALADCKEDAGLECRMNCQMAF